MSAGGGRGGRVVGALVALALLGAGAYWALGRPDDGASDPKAEGRVADSAPFAATPGTLPFRPSPSAGRDDGEGDHDGDDEGSTDDGEPKPEPVQPPAFDEHPWDEPDAGPEEAAPGAVMHLESRQEREMTATELAEQVDVMIARVTERADRTEALLAAARVAGDADAVRRQEVLLQRLRQRTEQLRTRAGELRQRAATEGPRPPTADHDHDHEHAHE